MQDLATLTRSAIDVLTGHELSPSTRDLCTVEGLAGADFAEDLERVSLLDEILAEYEAAAVADGNYDAVRAILRLREDCTPEARKIRQRTKVEFCDRHAPLFAGDSFYRKVESMLEGGYGGGPCKGGRCKLYPGRDLICQSTCERYGMAEMPLDWTTEDEADDA